MQLNELVCNAAEYERRDEVQIQNKDGRFKQQSFSILIKKKKFFVYEGI